MPTQLYEHSFVANLPGNPFKTASMHVMEKMNLTKGSYGAWEEFFNCYSTWSVALMIIDRSEGIG